VLVMTIEAISGTGEINRRKEETRFHRFTHEGMGVGVGCRGEARKQLILLRWVGGVGRRGSGKSFALVIWISRLGRGDEKP